MANFVSYTQRIVTGKQWLSYIRAGHCTEVKATLAVRVDSLSNIYAEPFDYSLTRITPPAIFFWCRPGYVVIRTVWFVDELLSVEECRDAMIAYYQTRQAEYLALQTGGLCRGFGL